MKDLLFLFRCGGLNFKKRTKCTEAVMEELALGAQTHLEINGVLFTFKVIEAPHERSGCVYAVILDLVFMQGFKVKDIVTMLLDDPSWKRGNEPD